MELTNTDFARRSARINVGLRVNIKIWVLKVVDCDILEPIIKCLSTSNCNQVIKDEQKRADEAKGNYTIKKMANGVTLLESGNTFGPYGDTNIKIFNELYLIDVTDYQNISGYPKTFLIIPTHYSDDQLDTLKENIKNVSVVDLPYQDLPID